MRPLRHFPIGTAAAAGAIAAVAALAALAAGTSAGAPALPRHQRRAPSPSTRPP